MSKVVYTLAVWKVRPGRGAEFIEACKVLGEIFSAPRHGHAPAERNGRRSVLFVRAVARRLEDVRRCATTRVRTQKSSGSRRCASRSAGGVRIVAQAPESALLSQRVGRNCRQISEPSVPLDSQS